VGLRHQIISGRERALLSHGSLVAEILNSMKPENIVSQWAWSQFLWTPQRSRMSSTDLLLKMLRDFSGQEVLLITLTSWLDGQTPHQEPSDFQTVSTGHTLAGLVCHNLITELPERIPHLRSPVWPFLTISMLMASNGTTWLVITRNQQSVSKEIKYFLNIYCLLLIMLLFIFIY